MTVWPRSQVMSMASTESWSEHGNPKTPKSAMTISTAISDIHRIAVPIRPSGCSANDSGKFREGRFDLLMQSFCTDEDTKPYDLVVLGAPVWIATPEPDRCPPSKIDSSEADSVALVQGHAAVLRSLRRSQAVLAVGWRRQLCR